MQFLGGAERTLIQIEAANHSPLASTPRRTRRPLGVDGQAATPGFGTQRVGTTLVAVSRRHRVSPIIGNEIHRPDKLVDVGYTERHKTAAYEIEPITGKTSLRSRARRSVNDRRVRRTARIETRSRSHGLLQKAQGVVVNRIGKGAAAAIADQNSRLNKAGGSRPPVTILSCPSVNGEGHWKGWAAGALTASLIIFSATTSSNCATILADRSRPISPRMPRR